MGIRKKEQISSVVTVSWRILVQLMGLVIVSVTAKEEETTRDSASGGGGAAGGTTTVKAERIVVPPPTDPYFSSFSHGKLQAWTALFQLEYDITVAIFVILAVLLVFLRALYRHLTVRPVKDVYKTKYH
jgi:hypothetical protein